MELLSASSAVPRLSRPFLSAVPPAGMSACLVGADRVWGSLQPVYSDLGYHLPLRFQLSQLLVPGTVRFKPRGACSCQVTPECTGIRAGQPASHTAPGPVLRSAEALICIPFPLTAVRRDSPGTGQKGCHYHCSKLARLQAALIHLLFSAHPS